MGSIAHIIIDDDQPSLPSQNSNRSSQKSQQRSQQTFKSSGDTELVPEHIMLRYERESRPRRPSFEDSDEEDVRDRKRPRHSFDEGYVSRNQLDNLSDRSASTAHTPREQPFSHSPNHLSESSVLAHPVVDKRYTALINDIQALRNFGIESKELPLPKICVVGGQSTGKSSLIEAISAIKVPRDDGCCTRCPLEINLRRSNDQDWKCTVSLVKKYMYTPGEPRRQRMQSNRLGPWTEQQPDPPTVFSIHTGPEDITEALKWAQIATLNPSSPWETYVPGRGFPRPSANIQVPFSPNIVKVDITAPGLEDLSFYDLPGVINVSETPDMVELIRKLVQGYIKDETCIVLLTLSMVDDVANSTGLALIKDTDGANVRTRGVLTKPDLLQEVTQQWVELLRETNHILGHGWSVVKNASDPFVPHAAARASEGIYFKNTEPWSTTLRELTGRCGTTNLQKDLSELLRNQILAQLPTITNQIDVNIRTVKEELEKLPEPPKDRHVLHVSDKFHEFQRDLQSQLEGGSPDHNYQKKWYQNAKDFREKLEKTRPTVAPYSIGEEKRKRKAQRNRDSGVQGTPNPFVNLIDEEMDGNGGSPGPKIRTSIGPEMSSSNREPNDLGESKTRPALRFGLDQIREINQDAHGAGLRIPYEPKAIERLNKLSIAHWSGLMNEFLLETEKSLKEMVHNEFRKTFSRLQNTAFFMKGSQAITNYFVDAFTEQRKYAERAYRIEHSKPFTINEKELELRKKETYAKLKDSRLQGRKRNHLDIEEGWGRRPPTQGDARTKALSDKRLEAEVGPDAFANEIKTMAYVRSYYDWAASRFADVICHGLQAELFVSCKTDLKARMTRELQFDSIEGLRTLLEPNQEVRQQREQLLGKLERFEHARERLAKYRILAPPETARENEEEMLDATTDM